MNFLSFLKTKEKTDLGKLIRAWRGFENYYNYILADERLAGKSRLVYKDEIKENLK
jgi:hypothetical protein